MVEQTTGKGKKIFWVVVVVFILCAVLGIIFGTSSQSESPDGASSSSIDENATEGPKTEKYSVILSAGYYTAGVDIPAGKYNLTATAGSGNVSSSNMLSGGLNEIMGVKDDDLYQKTFNDAQLTDGVVLSISGTLQLQLDCDAASTGDMKKRENTATKEYTFSSGNYTCGADFEPGEYVVTAVSGAGNVSSDNLLDGGINAIMAATDDDLYTSKFMNVSFKEGNTLKISGVEIKLTPSK